MLGCCTCCGCDTPTLDSEVGGVEHVKTDATAGILVTSSPAISRSEDLSAAPRARFEVVLDRQKDTDCMGIDLNADHDRALEILSIKDKGLVKSYNDRAPQDMKVREGYFITKVNGKADDVKAMIHEVTNNRRIRLEVAPKVEFVAHVRKDVGGLGVTLHYEDRDRNTFINAYNRNLANGNNKQQAKIQAESIVAKDQEMTLVVVAVSGGGVQAYNESVDQSLNILQWDRIKAVNGRRAKPKELLNMIQENDELDLVITRPID